MEKPTGRAKRSSPFFFKMLKEKGVRDLEHLGPLPRRSSIKEIEVVRGRELKKGIRLRE